MSAKRVKKPQDRVLKHAKARVEKLKGYENMWRRDEGRFVHHRFPLKFSPDDDVVSMEVDDYPPRDIARIKFPSQKGMVFSPSDESESPSMAITKIVEWLDNEPIIEKLCYGPQYYISVWFDHLLRNRLVFAGCSSQLSQIFLTYDEDDDKLYLADAKTGKEKKWKFPQPCTSSQIGVVSVSLSPSVLQTKHGHANMLFINFLENTIERLDPNGAYITTPAEYVVQRKIDEFFSNIAKEHGMRYLPPISTCPRLGPQIIAGSLSSSYCRKEKKGGFCAAWSLLYAHIRLLTPNSTTLEISRTLLSDKWFRQLDVIVSKYNSRMFRLYPIMFPEGQFNKIKKIGNAEERLIVM